MPYIPDKQIRDALIHGELTPAHEGEMNFLLTHFLHTYIKNKGLCYSTINEAIGILECCKLELYRMIAAPYEREKRRINGPVSNLEISDE